MCLPNSFFLFDSLPRFLFLSLSIFLNSYFFNVISLFLFLVLVLVLILFLVLVLYLFLDLVLFLFLVLFLLPIFPSLHLSFCLSSILLFFYRPGHLGHYRPAESHLRCLLSYFLTQGVNLLHVEVDVQRVMKIARQTDKGTCHTV